MSGESKVAKSKLGARGKPSRAFCLLKQIICADANRPGLDGGGAYGMAMWRDGLWKSWVGRAGRRRHGQQVQQDKVCHAHHIVSPCEEAYIVLRGALPFHGSKQSRYTARLVAPQGENFGSDAHEVPQRATVLFLPGRTTNGTFVLKREYGCEFRVKGRSSSQKRQAAEAHDAGFFGWVEVAVDGVSDVGLEFVEGIGLGEYGEAQGAGFVAAFGRFLN